MKLRSARTREVVRTNLSVWNLEADWPSGKINVLYILPVLFSEGLFPMEICLKAFCL
jgi:hypothetical protein